MNKAISPTLVGNDFSVRLNKPKEVPEQISEKVLMPEVVAPVNEPDLSEFSQNDMTLPEASSVGVLSRPINGTVFPTAKPIPKLTFVTKAKVFTFIALLISFGMTYQLVTQRHNIENLAYNLRSIAKQEVMRITGQTAALQLEAPNPLKMTIPAADTENALQDLISQQIVLNIASTKVAVDAATITSWLTFNSTSTKTYISVNTNAINTYLESLPTTYNKPVVNRVIDQRRWGLPIVKVNGQDGISVQYTKFNLDQIADNLLRAKGINITIPSQVTQYQTSVVSTPY